MGCLFCNIIEQYYGGRNNGINFSDVITELIDDIIQYHPDLIPKIKEALGKTSNEQLLMTTLYRLLIQIGVCNKDTQPNGPELIMLAEEYLKYESKDTSPADKILNDIVKPLIPVGYNAYPAYQEFGLAVAKHTATAVLQAVNSVIVCDNLNLRPDAAGLLRTHLQEIMNMYTGYPT